MDFYAHGLKLSAHGQHARAIEAFEQALAQNPSDARTLFALGNTARALGMRGPAEQFYRQVLALEPGRIEAVVNLASLLRANGQFAAAEALVRPILAQNPSSADLWLALGSVLREMGDSAGAVRHYREALARDAKLVPALANLADMLADEGQDGEALALYDRAIKLDPDNAQARLNRAICHFLNGRLREGWHDYAGRLKVPGKVAVADHGLKRWSGESLKRSSLLITTEQGVGDHLMFASLIPELAARAAAEGGRLILECEPRLNALFARSFPSVATHDSEITSREGVARSHYGWLGAMGGANAAIEIGSLPRLIRKTFASFPAPHAYLKPDPDEAAHWRARFQALPRPWVGVCWRSGMSGGARSVQYAPPQAWADFLRKLTGTPICVQYDARDGEAAAICGRMIEAEAIDQKRELDRTAALLSVLDAVVSAPTAVSWLAAGIGVPTAKALYDTSWTSFGKDFEPFAPAARCIMPKARGDWADVFDQTLAFLKSLPV